ncbi:MAG: hypothetical protein KBT88_02725 [Gammaproteobacteria bacterium]|nr:hypothetical protein [Gammaproteobacteria bacterium]MBQ0838671.1 hypothetical protein [Gammaproteobacteria bacterium]
MKMPYLALLLIALNALPASGQEPWRAAVQKVNFRNSTLVPIICQWDNPKYTQARWHKKYGSDFVWMNHYCSSKVKIPICLRYPQKERNECLTSQLHGIEYSITHPKKPGFALLPYLHTEHGDLLQMLNRHIDAIHDFQIALKINRKYIPAYIKLADSYIALKDYDSAETIARQGLTQKNSKALKRRLKKIEVARK